MSDKKSYPNCERLASFENEHRAIMEFLEGMGENHSLGKWNTPTGRVVPLTYTEKNDLILKHFGVDPIGLENERSEKLEDVRKQANG